MDRKKIIEESGLNELFYNINNLHNILSDQFNVQFNRSIPFADELFDRWERAQKLKFQPGSSIYDSCYVFGNVKVGKNTWIGPFTIIDGSGELSIGDNCTISAGVHIYTHDNIKKTLSGGKLPIEKAPVIIDDNVYIAPNSIISKGVTIGKNSLIAACSLVNKSVPEYSVVAGSPAKIIGKVIFENDNIKIEYLPK